MSILITIAAFVLVLSFLVLIHELGHFWAARLLGIKVRELGIGFPPRARGFWRNGIVYSLNWIPVGGFVRLEGESDPDVPEGYAGKPVWARATVLVAGSGMNLLLAWFIFSGLASLPTERLVDSEIVIQAVAPGSPADGANLRAGDVILSVNGEDVRTVDQLARHVSDSLGEEVTLRVLRGSVPLAVYLVPRENPPPGEGPLGVTISLINPVFERQSAPIWQAPWNGILLMGNVITSTASEFGRAASSGSNPGIAGPLGIAQATGEAARAGPVALLIIVGLLSLNLGILNLLPIPALDGGRIPFLILEVARRGRRLSPQRENLVHLIGFVFLISLVLFVTVGIDLPRLLQGDSILP